MLTLRYRRYLCVVPVGRRTSIVLMPNDAVETSYVHHRFAAIEERQKRGVVRTWGVAERTSWSVEVLVNI